MSTRLSSLSNKSINRQIHRNVNIFTFLLFALAQKDVGRGMVSSRWGDLIQHLSNVMV